jgi:phosphohistidine phosphatase
MRLYLVQHGEAVTELEDPTRPLTARGREEVTRAAALIRLAGVKVYQIWHSGKRRAEETAAILAGHLEPASGVVSVAGLAPKDDVRPMAELLDRESRPLMLVGHRPFLDRLAGLLLVGDSGRTVVQFEKGGIVCLERDAESGSWAVVWALTPELIPGDYMSAD